TLCFSTLIWGQNRSPPFYNLMGRFGKPENSFQSQLWYYHYYVMTAYGIGIWNGHFAREYGEDHNPKSMMKTEQEKKSYTSLQYFPKITWVLRDSGNRRMGNLQDIQSYFQIKGVTVNTCCDWSVTHPMLFCILFANWDLFQSSVKRHVFVWQKKKKKKHRLKMDEHQRFNTLRTTMKQFYASDVVIGLHGAGLTNILYTKPGTILIELKVPYGYAWGSFANIASQMGLAYYSADVRRLCNPLCILPKKYIKQLLMEVLSRFKDELLHGAELTKQLDLNEEDSYCLLQMPSRYDPTHTDPVQSLLRPFLQSRCYFSDMNSNRTQWAQIFDHFDYNTNFLYKLGNHYGTWLDPENTLKKFLKKKKQILMENFKLFEKKKQDKI
ncbi:hypothetical protein RFI_13256, partial [Reticulomyxa filosa]